MDIKLEIFKFRNQLTPDQFEESKIAQAYLENYDKYSEKEIVSFIRESLSSYVFDETVKSFLENVQGEIESKPFVYDLKDLYKKIERNDIGLLNRPALVKLLEIINLPDDDARMEKVLSELVIYDYVPEIRHFLMNVTANPIERENLKNSGKANKVYTLVERVDNGHLAYIADRWFILQEDKIEQAIPEDYIKEEGKIREIRILEEVLKSADIIDDKINFRIDENLTIGISTKDKQLYLNGEKQEAETTLEALFNSPFIPSLKKNFYLLIETAKQNLDKFVDLDVALRVQNILNPYLESYVFNYKDKMYIYSKDVRRGSQFFQYENVTELIRDVQKELDYDLSKFFENKLSKEVKHLKALEDKEQAVELKLKTVNESIDKLLETDLLTEDAELKVAHNNLLVYKKQLLEKLDLIKADKIKSRKQIING
jgi:hypothetical protein